MEKNVKLVIGIFIMALMITVSVAGCSGPSASPTATPKATPKVDLTVFAAASLSGAFNETKAAYEASHPNVNIKYNFDGSPTLRTQIEQGAYADVFASASTPHMNALKKEGYMNNSTVVNFVNNKLAVIVPKDNPAKIGSLQDLARPGVKIVMGTKDLPVGNYTLQILDKMANNSSYGKEYKDKVMANVISRETTVNHVVAKVALGEADAGFAYVSDVPAEYRGKVSTIPIPDSLNVVAVYPIGVLKESKNPEEAQKFIDFVRSDEGKAILAKYGFMPV